LQKRHALDKKLCALRFYWTEISRKRAACSTTASVTLDSAQKNNRGANDLTAIIAQDPENQQSSAFWCHAVVKIFSG
jgi:hypothetical protein